MNAKPFNSCMPLIVWGELAVTVYVSPVASVPAENLGKSASVQVVVAIVPLAAGASLRPKVFQTGSSHE